MKTYKELWLEHMTGPKDNLRHELIEAIACHEGWEESAVALFDEAIMPILQAAMDKGQLLVSRTSKERIPVPVAMMTWIDGVLHLATQVMEQRNTISKRQLLKIFFSMAQNAAKAKADIEAST